MPIYIYLNKYTYTNMPMHIPIHSYIRVRGHTIVNIISEITSRYVFWNL